MTANVPDELARLATRDGAMVVVDRDGTVVLVNPAAAALWGVDKSHFVGEPIESLVPSALRRGHQAYRRGFLAEPDERDMAEGMEPHLQRPRDETLVPITVHLEPLTVGGHQFVAAHVSPRGAG
jgi:PAS domain S-box-containing protein